jgi:glycopeptide antibiotics resistance protein
MLLDIQNWLANKGLPKPLLIANILCVLFLTLSPADKLQVSGEIFDIPHIDKLVHAFIFFTLVISFYFAFPQKKILSVFLMPFLFSIIIELLQYLMPFGRSFDLMDVLANLTGIIIGLLLIYKGRLRLISK